MRVLREGNLSMTLKGLVAGLIAWPVMIAGLAIMGPITLAVFVIGSVISAPYLLVKWAIDETSKDLPKG